MTCHKQLADFLEQRAGGNILQQRRHFRTIGFSGLIPQFNTELGDKACCTQADAPGLPGNGCAGIPDQSQFTILKGPCNRRQNPGYRH